MYAVIWGVKYEEGAIIAQVPDEKEACEIAENESECNRCRMSVFRKSDRRLIAKYEN